MPLEKTKPRSQLNFFTFRLLFPCLIFTTAKFGSSAVAAENLTAEIPSGLISVSEEMYSNSPLFVVDKTKRTLRVYGWKNGVPQLEAEHAADIGKRAGDKEKENDHRTPVGIYFLEKKLTPPEIPFDLYGSKAFTTDYPNIFDRRLQKSGSGIWLHAIPDTVPLTRGSRGCVVVRDQVIHSLSERILLGQTPLLIFDEVRYITQSEFEAEKSKFLTQFEQWRKAWETSDVPTYMQYYDPTFKAGKMDYEKWANHKSKLKELYKFIKVELSTPTILRNKNQVVIRTLQRYKSDKHEDFGEKTIHASYSPDVGFRIIREDWKPLPRSAFTHLQEKPLLSEGT